MARPGVNKQKWWKEAVVYQIYPASFLSTGTGTGAGWGDIRGITSKLDYLKHLGVDIVWLSPIYKSPQFDMGYDISDYQDIDSRYGTLEDVDELVRELKRRDMRLVMDLVVNHTSHQHQWFLDSRSSKTSAKRDWYHWQPAKYDKHGERHPPNNWGRILGESSSAWTWDEASGEYFLSLFTAEQPDLNWENPIVREAVHDVLRFWLNRGVSGFRMDVINHISKVPGCPDAKVKDALAPYQPGYMHYCNGPRLHEFLQEMNGKVLSKYDAMTVGEMPFVRDEKEILQTVGSENKELNMIFIFEIVDIDNAIGDFRLTLRHWEPREIKQIMSKWQRFMIDNDGWNSLFIENHDNPRSVSRYCDDSDDYRELGSKLLCLMLTTLSGTLYIYQGQEIGMRNFPLDWDVEEYKDCESTNYWEKMMSLHGDDPNDLNFGKDVLQRKARDHSRTPMQWNAEPNAGFCPAEVKPWMRVMDDYKTINAQYQAKQSDPNKLSTLQFWKRGIASRKEHKQCLVYGEFDLLGEDHPTVFAYKRTSKDEIFVVVLNFYGKHTVWDVPSDCKIESWVAGNYTAGKPEKPTRGKLSLRPWEGLIGKQQYGHDIDSTDDQ